MALYNGLNTAVLEERVVLPADCRVRVRALDNLKETAPLVQWSRGFMVGHQWLDVDVIYENTYTCIGGEYRDPLDR